MRIQGTCYRAHDPRWSFAPLSGDGARLNGGRFNAKGRPALYLSESRECCVLEACQGLMGRMEPLTLVSYDVDIRDIADLTDPATRDRLDITFDDLACAWMLDRAAGRIPPSWKVSERLREGHAGIRVPSFVPGATDNHVNLVLWFWNDHPDRLVEVYDPDGRLPRDASSWRD